MFEALCAPVLAVVISATPTPAVTPGAALNRLCDEYWQGYLEAHPTTATSLGDKRWDDRLEDITEAGLSREVQRLEDVLARAKAIDEKLLGAPDRLTRTALITEVEGQIARDSCGFEAWVVDPLNGPQVDFMSLPDLTTIETAEDGGRYVKRVRAMGPYLDDHIANLRRGLAQGKVASHDCVQKALTQLESLVASPAESLAVWKPAVAARKGWNAAARATFQKDLKEAITGSLAPGLQRYRDFLKSEVLPAARPQDKAGLAALPGGVDSYRRMIRVHTSLDLDPAAVHQLGLEQVAKFRHDLAELGQKVFGTSDIAEIQKRLRSDPAMRFRTAAEVEAKARETLAKANAAVPKWFGRFQPRTKCQVQVMGMYEAPYSTIAYYREPGGKRPGTYMINTYLPETRPRYEAEALAFHESVPGHHLQIAVAQELTGIPEFRKQQGVTAFVEGWGLYSERLAADMGLYSSDVDRIGMLSYDAWRACRLVVDTGMHAMGWSRQQAIDYMMANSCLAENNVINEVDRYLTWPGQALAYKVGQLEILKLRDEAKQRLGARFDIKAFHDAVLGNGAVALPVLREQVEAYITGVEGAK